jgi:hypothetical protein
LGDKAGFVDRAQGLDRNEDERDERGTDENPDPEGRNAPILRWNPAHMDKELPTGSIYPDK